MITIMELMVFTERQKEREGERETEREKVCFECGETEGHLSHGPCPLTHPSALHSNNKQRPALASMANQKHHTSQLLPD